MTDMKTKTMKKIVEAFGTLEYFKPYAPDGDSQLKPGDHPPGHDSPRTDTMDPNVWEVKWEHRDDCITALSVTLSTLICHLQSVVSDESPP